MSSANTALRVLLVEDNPGDAERIREVLSETGLAQFAIDHVERLSQALARLAETPFDAILLDLSLPDSVGLATLVRVQGSAGETPIVILSGLANDQVALAAVRSGADDYLFKGHAEEALLPRALLYAVERRRLRHQLERSEERLREEQRLASEQRLLAEVGALLLSAPIDNYQEPLKRLADLAIESMADCCIVNLVDDGGKLGLVAVAVADASKAKLASELREFPLDWDRASPSTTTSRPRRSELVPELGPEVLESWTRGEAHRLRLLRALAPKSLIVVPLVAREELYGSLVFLSSRPERRYGPRDLWVAEELARRAGLSIENARLYQASQLATRARDQALGVIAHDLRSPLSGILIGTETLLGRPPQERKNGPLEAIQRAAERMKRLIGDLLDVHRIEAGQLSVDPRPHSAEELVREAVEVMRPLSKSIALDIDLADSLPAVVADRDRVEQVFSNLIGNAIKHSARDGRITLGAKRVGNCVRFSVADTGSGISATDLPHIFDRFWQARRADKRGVGLGLPICKGIVEAHGGAIWAESRPGLGTTLFFILPVARTVAKELPIPAPHAPGPSG